MPENQRILGNHDREIANTARIGIISEIDDLRARVLIGDITTDLIPWMTRRAAQDYDYWHPAIGEQVVVLTLWGDPSQSVILGSIAQDKYPAPAKGITWAKQFRDGTLIIYDPESHTLNIKAAQSPISILCDNITIKANSATLDVPKIHCTGTIKVDGDVVASGISLKSHTHGSVKAGPDKTGKPE